MPLVLEPADGVAALSIEFDGIAPDRLADRPLHEIARLHVRADGRPVELGLLFRVSGTCADGRIECVGDFSRVHRAASRMAWGEFLVRGSVGRHAGEGMGGGRLVVEGNAGDWLAAEMAGGAVQVGGSAGDNAAAALPGSESGMRGGLVVIAGDAGHLAGARMRRGLLAIGGSCGEAAAFEMRAGTVFVAGPVGPRAGLGMRRGSVIAAGPRPAMSPSFKRGAAWSPTFLNLLGRRLDEAGFRPNGLDCGAFLGGTWRQWHGDLLTGGRGEIFHRHEG